MSMKNLYTSLLLIILTFIIPGWVKANNIEYFTLSDDTELEVRIFPGSSDTILLGFPCDEGKSANQEATAQALADLGIEIWMPDFLSAYMLPKLKSSYAQLPTEALVSLIDSAINTGKKVYVIAGGADTELILRGSAQWEAEHQKDPRNGILQGAILLFPRLMATQPEPGVEPKYAAAVGKTKLPIILLEGERTPNRWGVNHLSQALQANGSQVTAKIIPDVRGYFFSRDDANVPEELVTSQLSGLINASMYLLNGANNEAK